MTLTKRNTKRSIALLLVLTMLISAMNIGAAIGTKAVQNAETVSCGNLLADNASELGDAEKSILRSGLLAGETVTYQSPDNSDALIAVDPDAKEITLSPYTDELGNTWTAVACRVVYEEGQETVTLSDGKGSFAYAGDAYSVEADYKLTVAVSNTALAEKLMKAPYMLAKGIKNLDVLCSSDVQVPLDVLAQNKDLLQKLVDGYDMYGPTGVLVSHVELPSKANAQNLIDQCDANEGKLDLKVKGDECKNSASKTAYLMNSGADIKRAAEGAYTDVQAIYADLTNPAYQSAMLAYGLTTQEILDTVCNSLSPWLETVKSVIDDPWAILDNADVLAEGLTDAQYAELDTLIAADATLADRTFEGAVPEALDVKTVTVEAEVNRYTVTVQVSAQVIDKTDVNTAELTALPTETTVIKMTAGSTGADVLSQIEASGVEESALAGWDSFYGVNEDNYIRSVSVDLTEDYTLEGNITYTITYTPRTLTVTYGEGYAENEKTPAEVPYGYQMKLPAYNGDLVYDYTVNGSEADQGDVVRITGNTSLSRVTGKAWNYYGIGKLVSGNYAVGDTVAQNILTSTALRTGTFRLRTPGNADGLLSMDSSTGVYTVTAKAFKADTGDLWWIPETGTLKGGEADGTAISFTLADGINYTAEFDAGLSFDRIAVNYKVVLPWSVVGVTAEEALEILNLPHVLTTEAKEQLSSMNTLNGQYANIEALSDNLNAIWMSANGSDMPQESKDALKSLINNCQNKDGVLYLYQHLNAYRACETQGEQLAFYYRNYDGVAGIKAQIDRFCESFKVVAVDNRDSFVDFLAQIKYDQYVDKIDQIYSAMTDIQSGLIAPNASVGLNGAGLNDLADLTAGGIDLTTAYGTALEMPVISTEVSVDSPNKISIYIDVQVKNSDGDLMKEESGDVSFMAENGTLTLTAEQAAYLDNLKSALCESVFASQAEKDHYKNVTVEGMPAQGDTLTNTVYVKIVYRPTVYTVNFADAEGNIVSTASFPYDNPVLPLAVSEEDSVRYDYNIDGAWVSGSSYTFTANQIDRLFTENSLTVTKRVVNINREKIEQLIDSLNNAVEEAGLTFQSDGKTCLIASFIPVEKDGNLSVVMRVNPTKNDNYNAALKKVAQVLANTTLSYVEIDGNVLKADDQVHLQGLINALLNSGVGLHTVQEAIDPNGDIVEMSLEGTPVGANEENDIPVGSGVIKDTSLLGGKLIETSLFLGDSAESGENVSFYITIEDFDREADNLKKVRNSVTSVRKYADLTAEGGRLNLELKVSDRVYQAVISAMVAANLVDIEDITSVDPVKVVHYIYDLVKSVPMDKEITDTTLSNTLRKFDKEVNLAAYNEIAKVLRNLIYNSQVTDEAGQDDTYHATLNYDLTYLFEKLNASALSGIFAEAVSGVALPVGLKIDNLGKSYKAVVIDVKASGTNKLRYYGSEAELQSALDNLSTTGVVILLSDIDGDLVVNTQKVLLNLNGKTVNGSLTANAKTVVLDTSANNAGGVAGSVTGNVSVTAGNYISNISALLPAGYSLTGGKVVNNLYVWSEDAEGNYTITVNADALKMDKAPSARNMALELAADVIVKHFTSASLSFDGYTLYDVAVNDLVDIAAGGVDAADANELLASIDNVGITGFVNDLLGVLTDLNAISTAMNENGGVLKTYTMATGSWTVSLERVAEGDYLTANISSGTEKEVRNVTLKIQDNADGDFAKLVDKAKDVVTFNDVSINLNEIDYANQAVNISGNGNADVVINLKNDTDYAAVVAVILTEETDGDVKANLVNALKKYAEFGRTDDLKEAIEAVTVSQLLTALKNMTRDGFAGTLAGLGIENLDSAALLEAAYDDMLVMVGKIASKLNINGGSRTIGSYADSFGSYELTGTYSTSTSGSVNLSASADVKVVLNLLDPDPDWALVGIEIKQLPNTLEYRLTQSLDLTGMVVVAQYEDGYYEEITDYTVSGFDSETLGDKTVTVTYEGFTDTFTVSVVRVVGDINNDGKVNVSDVICIKRILSGKDPEPENILIADIDNDGKISAKDANLLKLIVAGR